MRRQPTPIDERTRMPLLIMPTNDDVLQLLYHPKQNARRREEGREFIDANHAHHPKNVDALTSPKGKAVRDSVLQYVMRRTHDTYHETYDGPWLPVRAEDRFRTVVFAVGGYVPRMAIDLRGASPKETALDNGQVMRLQTSGEVRPAQMVTIRNFTIGHLLTRVRAEYLPESLVDEFLETQGNDANSCEWRQELIEELFPKIVEPTVEPLDGIYRDSVRDCLWPTWRHESPLQVVDHIVLGDGDQARQQKLREFGGMLFDILDEQCYGRSAASVGDAVAA